MTTGAQEVAATATGRSGWKVAASVSVVVLCALLWLGISLPGGDLFGLAIFDASSWMTFAAFIAGFGLVFAGYACALFRRNRMTSWCLASQAA